MEAISFFLLSWSEVILHWNYKKTINIGLGYKYFSIFIRRVFVLNHNRMHAPSFIYIHFFNIFTDNLNLKIGIFKSFLIIGEAIEYEYIIRIYYKSANRCICCNVGIKHYECFIFYFISRKCLKYNLIGQ